jgi:hypothetical protein
VDATFTLLEQHGWDIHALSRAARRRMGEAQDSVCGFRGSISDQGSGPGDRQHGERGGRD